MPRYYTKPVEVEALRFTGFDDNSSKILHLIFQAGQKAEWKSGTEAWAHENGIVGYPGTEEIIILETARGPLYVYKGSWFVKTRPDHIEVMDNETFKTTYEELSWEESH